MATDEGEALGNGRVGGDDDRLGGHEPAGGVGVVGEQEADVLRLLGLHEVEQGFTAQDGQLGDEVGRVVGLHVVEHVGGALVVEAREEGHLVGFGHLFEGVGEALVGQLFGDFEAAAVGQFEECGREVCGKEVVVLGDELLGALRLGAVGDFDDVAPACEDALPLGERGGHGAGLAQEELLDGPFAGAGLFDRDVFDDGGAVPFAEAHRAADELSEHAHFATALLETAQVDEAGRDDLAAADARDTTDGEEHAPTTGHFDDETHDAGRFGGSVDDEDVAHLADPVACGVENGAPVEPGDEDSRGAHG